jgi:cell migration-inducing and hyaluronan-binding protein
VTSGQYFKDSSIWHTFNRCVTVHGTRNVRVSGNVCHDNIGHSYFLEDGAETGNVFEDNLAVLTQKPASGQALIPSDVTPAAYWITNPDNIFRRNVAAGSRGFGFWFALPAAPTGLSTGQPDRPRETPLGEFSDNVAHSNSNVGLQVDQGPRADLTLETVHYSPRQVPGTNSPPVTANFRNFTGYKHAGRAVWLRGTELRLSGAMLADNAIGATFASNETFLQDAVLVGQSANTGGTQIPAGFPIRGYEFYDGRVGAERVTFVNFQGTGNRIMSALGFNRNNGFPVNTGNYDGQITLVNSNAVYIENPAADKDGDKAAVILDTDGSITGTAGHYVAANNPLMVTPSCTYRPAWNSWVCSNRFIQLQVRGQSSQRVAPLSLVRDDQVGMNYVGVPDQPQTVAASIVPGRGYTVAYGSPVPDRPQFVISRTVAGEWIRISAPYPQPSFNVIRDGANNSPLPPAATLALLDASTGEMYFYDAVSGVLHLKLYTRAGRTSTTVSVVPR